MAWNTVLIALGLTLPAWFAYTRLSAKPRRANHVLLAQERVLILGASSGIGRAIAHKYAARGARVCILGRRREQLETVLQECEDLIAQSPHVTEGGRTLSIVADCTSPEDMVRLRMTLEQKWKGLDTLIVSAGVSALRPLLEIAGVQQACNTGQTTLEGAQRTVDVALAAVQGNYIAPLLSAVTLIPFMRDHSASPSILLISSLAAAIPAPTRTLYASTKAASLVLFQALSIEHPEIAFSYILPSTVQGDFRASAVDGGPVREANPNAHGLKTEAVAARCVQAVDAGEKVVFFPAYYRWGQILYWFLPAFVERKAIKKYQFTVPT
ncbi:NAD(P)-binding protein [Artomyces pyxidatus]|uniref:NAD(P)-binding protein n=1 Tax=Artomyces pyxidatus TaxID=48021 RepID=A0ACB8TGK7_9AGAM|nr:NAD(P)-binding protein [Artomyces pyxidatus]